MCVPMISIIIPVYNTQKYIIDCLDSLVKQTYQDFEVLLVNDGSTDASAQIIADYIAKNNLTKFHLFNKENAGVSSARNLGLEHARGKWIAFIDSDDWAEPGYLQHMIEAVQKHPVDFCMAGFLRYYEDSGEFHNSRSVSFAHNSIDELLPEIIYNHLYGRLFSTSVIAKHGLRFDESIHFAEDSAFMFDYVCHTKEVLLLPLMEYVYRVRSGSLTTSLVRPHKKKGLSSHAFSFWNAFDQNDVIQQAFANSYHVAHGIVDAFLTDMICAVLDKDTARYIELASHPITLYAVKYYRHAEASRREKTLVFLLKYRLHFAVKALIKLYYSDSLNKTIRKLLKKERK